jgi:hypothetical protein
VVTSDCFIAVFNFTISRSKKIFSFGFGFSDVFLVLEFLLILILIIALHLADEILQLEDLDAHLLRAEAQRGVLKEKGVEVHLGIDHLPLLLEDGEIAVELLHDLLLQIQAETRDLILSAAWRAGRSGWCLILCLCREAADQLSPVAKPCRSRGKRRIGNPASVGSLRKIVIHGNRREVRSRGAQTRERRCAVWAARSHARLSLQVESSRRSKVAETSWLRDMVVAARAGARVRIDVESHPPRAVDRVGQSRDECVVLRVGHLGLRV